MRKGTNSLQFIHLLNKTKQALGGGKRKTSEMVSAEGLREGGGGLGRRWKCLIKKSCSDELAMLWFAAGSEVWMVATVPLKILLKQG